MNGFKCLKRQGDWLTVPLGFYGHDKPKFVQQQKNIILYAGMTAVKDSILFVVRCLS